MTPPVYLPGVGALLPTGEFIPEADVRAAVDRVAALCDWLRSLPAEAWMAVQVEAAMGGEEL